jgi:hypothetical protein
MKRILSLLFAFMVAIVVATPAAHALVLPDWSTYSSDITMEEFYVFDEAMDGFVGVDYNPIAVATQLVSGFNYRFFSNAEVVSLDGASNAAIIEIYVPLDGSPQITDIYQVP